MKNEATPTNAKGLIKTTSDEKRGNPNKHRGVHQKRPPMKKEATPTNEAHQKRPPLKKEATPTNTKGLVKKDMR
jgi:hypothetical protein